MLPGRGGGTKAQRWDWAAGVAGMPGKQGLCAARLLSPRSALNSPHTLRLPRAAAGRGGVPGSAPGAPASQAGELVPGVRMLDPGYAPPHSGRSLPGPASSPRPLPQTPSRYRDQQGQCHPACLAQCSGPAHSLGQAPAGRGASFFEDLGFPAFASPESTPQLASSAPRKIPARWQERGLEAADGI